MLISETQIVTDVHEDGEFIEPAYWRLLKQDLLFLKSKCFELHASQCLSVLEHQPSYVLWYIISVDALHNSQLVRSEITPLAIIEKLQQND